MHLRIAPFLALSLLLTACGNSTSKPLSSSAISGNWQMSLIPSNPNSQPVPQAGFLADTGGAITGSMLFDNPPCTGIGNVTGTVNGSNISLLVTPVDVQINLTGTLGSDQTTMSGDYTVLSTGCSINTIAPQAGTWSANLVTPLNGSLSGTFSSTNKGQDYAVTGSLTQGKNDGSSNAPVTGTLSFTGFCVTDVSVAGIISGTSLALALVNPDGSQAGQLRVTTSLDGKSVTGTYNMIPQGQSGTSPCISGDSGAVTLTM